MTSIHDILAPEPSKQEPQPSSITQSTPLQRSVHDHQSTTTHTQQSDAQHGDSMTSGGTSQTITSFQNDSKPDMTSSMVAPGSAASLTAVSSTQAANKMRHLKKEDGIPLWRKDIQYDFLRLVFFDKTKCFRKYKGNPDAKHTFAEIYIETMANSSKCSKILKEKLLSDGEGAISVAMVCLLVNLGRMNTTLNCE